MTSTDVPRNASQKLTGGIQPSQDVTFGDGAAPLSFTIHTVAAGLQEKLNVLVTNVNFPTDGSNIRIRLAGNSIRELVREDSESINESGVTFQSIDYILKGGDTVGVTTANTGTAHLQTCRITVSVLQSVKQ